MSKIHGTNTMPQHKNTTDRPPVEKTQTADHRQTDRLYPSLPSTDRLQVCAAHRCAGEELPHRPDRLAQSEASAAGGDVRMKAQIFLLEEQRQELLSINEKWSKEYRTMVRYYKERVQDLKASLQRGHSEEEEEVEAIASSKKAEGKDGDGLLRAEREAEELRAQNSTLARKGEHQREEIRRLNRALEEALQVTRPLGVSCETLQDVWKHQAEVYKEDFLKERSDREKLKEKCLEQEKKFRKVHSELRVLKSQLTWTPLQPPPRLALKSGDTDEAACPHWEPRQINRQHNQLQRRRNSKP
ncbi:TNFAIP3-interacting protein 1-like [Clinocottus analis]|uniref:TNFAIP3-interacting protein 1-like n=1 Tax=Clinocottus analis TaxID=304258 RepID=UPI0035C0E23D